MSREWGPGDVAMVTARWIRTDEHSERYAVRRAGGWISRASISVGDWEVSAVRPLVVIDPEDVEQVERLWTAWRDLAPDHRLAQDNLVAALREYAAPKPPKPEELREPTEMTAVVAEASGRYWVRVAPAMDGSFRPWHSGRDRSDWSDIDAVRVLSHGVTEGEA